MKASILKNNLEDFLDFLFSLSFSFPILFLKSGRIETLEAYIPNLDLIATVIGYGTGPLGGRTL